MPCITVACAFAIVACAEPRSTDTSAGSTAASTAVVTRASRSVIAPECGRVRVRPRDSYGALSARCYGSRTYASWLSDHNRRGTTSLRAGDTVDVPPFETLLDEELTGRWSTERDAIGRAFELLRKAQPEIEEQLRAAPPGRAAFQPSEEAKSDLQAAADALKAVSAHLVAAGVRTRKFAQAVEQLERLASGTGSFSTDYAVEDLHQCFSYGVDALK